MPAGADLEEISRVLRAAGARFAFVFGSRARFDADVAQSVARAVGFRNVLVHGYTSTSGPRVLRVRAKRARRALRAGYL